MSESFGVVGVGGGCFRGLGLGVVVEVGLLRKVFGVLGIG